MHWAFCQCPAGPCYSLGGHQSGGPAAADAVAPLDGGGAGQQAGGGGVPVTTDLRTHRDAGTQHPAGREVERGRERDTYVIKI